MQWRTCTIVFVFLYDLRYSDFYQIGYCSVLDCFSCLIFGFKIQLEFSLSFFFATQKLKS